MLLDTDILIDLLREHPPAAAWFVTLSSPVFVSGFAAMELAQGCKDKAALRKTQKFLAPFLLLWPSSASMTFAYEKYSDLRLSHNLGLLDSLIAATALEYGEDLGTFNGKHFKAVRGLVTVQPYMK